MNAPERIVDWSEANQRLLVAEFARLATLLGGTPHGAGGADGAGSADSVGSVGSASSAVIAHSANAAYTTNAAGNADTSTHALDALRAAMPEPAAIDTLASLFGLGPFERDLLLLVAGVEMDARIAALCAQAGGPPQRPWASFGIALATLPDPHWSAIAPQESLRRWRLLDIDENAPLASGRLRLDERVLHFIAGINALDHRLHALLQSQPPAGAMGRDQQAAVDALLQHLRSAVGGPLPAIVLEGDDAAGQRDVAAAVAAGVGAGLYRLRAADVPTAAAEQAAFAALWSREAVLLGCGLLVDAEEPEPHGAVARLVERLDGLVFACGQSPALGDERAQLRRHIARPDAPERRLLWQQALAGKADALGPALVDTLASQYRLGARRISQIAAQAAWGDESDGHGSNGDGDGDGNGDGDGDRGNVGDGSNGSHHVDATTRAAALHQASRGNAQAMPGLAQRIETRARWADLVLPEAQQNVLRQIAAHARHRLTVHHQWGFASQGPRGLGIATLFWGDSGTGKTLAAEVIANELGLALYRIDLSAVVSKYIGETEKNLRKVFDAAEEAGAILLFDEADALFGKRSEVKDSHDRYANIEVSYLLQRMEAFGGLAILTTNHKAALDAAFQRRLRFVVHFPFPDQAQREGIWRATFPAGAPLDAGIDPTRLARLSVAGGTIRNIALAAAFLAAEAGTPIGMGTLLQAAQLEAAKRDKPYSDAETRGWL